MKIEIKPSAWNNIHTGYFTYTIGDGPSLDPCENANLTINSTILSTDAIHYIVGQAEHIETLNTNEVSSNKPSCKKDIMFSLWANDPQDLSPKLIS